ncbi:MAG TPA: hypothetical protein VGL02_27375 [Streptomyces sp.]
MDITAAETPIAKWHRTHPGVSLEKWVAMCVAAQDVQSDWSYRQSGTRLPEKYNGQHGWWL